MIFQVVIIYFQYQVIKNLIDRLIYHIIIIKNNNNSNYNNSNILVSNNNNHKIIITIIITIIIIITKINQIYVQYKMDFMYKDYIKDSFK